LCFCRSFTNLNTKQAVSLLVAKILEETNIQGSLEESIRLDQAEKKPADQCSLCRT
jgi:hypothetical protein